MTRLKLLCFCLIIQFLTTTAYSDICMHSDTAKPEMDPELGVVLAAWVVDDRTPIRTCPENGTVSGYKYKFGDRFFLADEEEREVDGKAWKLVLVNTGDRESGDKYEAVGWIRRNSLLEDEYPLMDPATSISYKALITNKGKGGGQQVIPVYFNPERSGKPAHELSVRSVFYIFRLAPLVAEDMIQEKIPKSARSVLIGYMPALNSFDPHAGLGLLGWVNPRYVTLWNTRESLTLNGRVPIYKSMEDAKRHNSRAVIATSSGKKVKFDATRSPVLKSVKEGNNTLYKIGFFGEMDPSALGFNKGFGDANLKLEIHYVLDASSSMGKWFKVAMSTVRKSRNMIEQLAKKHRLQDPTYGLTFYRDKAVRPGSPSNPKCAVETETIPQSPNVDEFVSRLQREPACDWDRDKPESVYNGLRSAIKNARFQGFSYRMIIHIGDAPDHGRGASYDEILRLMDKERINYFALDVSPEGNTMSRSVQPLVKEKKSGVRDTAIHYGTQDAESKIIELIRKATDSVKQQKKVLDALKKGFGGDGGTAEAIFSDRVYKQVLEMLDREGITMIEKRKLQVYEEGWVSSKTRRGQLNDYSQTLLVRQENINKLSTMLYDLHSVTPSPRGLKRTWGKVIEEYTGDVCNPDEKIQACFDQAGAISFRSGFLNYSLEELVKLLQTNMTRFREIQCDLKKAHKGLRSILEQKLEEHTKIPGGECNIKTRHIREQKRWYHPDSDSSLAWIDVKDMP